VSGNQGSDTDIHSRALSGLTAIVTGGVTGIGLAISRRLLTDGATVLVAARSGEELKTGLDALGPHVVGFVGDLSDPAVAEELLATAVEALGGVDVLVNNAGGGVIRPTLEHTEETLRSTIDNNLWTTLRCCLAVLPHMVERGGGRIVNIGAESVRNGLTDHAVYNAAKGGVHALAVGLAREFAGAGITVNTVAPSYTRRRPHPDGARSRARRGGGGGRVPGPARCAVRHRPDDQGQWRQQHGLKHIRACRGT